MITSAQNAKIQEVRRLTAKKKERDAAGRYVLEGIRLCEEALNYASDCCYVLYAEPLSERGRRLVRHFSDAGTETEEISPRLMESIAATDGPQGVLAVMTMQPLPLPKRSDFVIIADGIQDPGNLGTLFRTAAAAGADGLLLMPGCADVFSPKVIRSAMGTHFRMPFTHKNWEQAETFLHREQNLQVFVADSDGGISCWETDFTRPCGLIIGSEGNGPCDAALTLADARVLIPMPGAIESLNASIAAGILIFEAVRQRS